MGRFVRIGMVTAAVVVGGVLALMGWSGARTGLEVGDRVPDTRLVGTDGKMHGLRDQVGRSWVVVSWYLKAATSG